MVMPMFGLNTLFAHTLMQAYGCKNWRNNIYFNGLFSFFN